MRKIIFIGQIVIIHFWFILASYGMITHKEEPKYLGYEPTSKTFTEEFIFYISLFVLIVFYAYIFAVKALKKKK